MPKIHDIIDNHLSGGLSETLKLFRCCYFNLCGGHEIAEISDSLSGMMFSEKTVICRARQGS